MYYYGSHIGKGKKGWLSTLKEAHQVGATAAQIFVGGPMSARISDKVYREYVEIGKDIKLFARENNFKIFIHSPYVLNFAKDPSTEGAYWIDALLRELQVAEAIGAEGCVLHMGKSVNIKPEQAEDFMFQNVQSLLAKMRHHNLTVKLFLETSSGQGTELFPTTNNSIHAVASFFHRFSSEDRRHLGFCVDTCHIYAAGFDIGTPQQAEAFFDAWTQNIGIEYLGVVHFNNSEKAYQSRVDRHACIQYGKIPVQGLLHFLKLTYQHHIPAILETPAGLRELPILQAVAADTPISIAPPKPQAIVFLENLMKENTVKEETKKKVIWKSSK